MSRTQWIVVGALGSVVAVIFAVVVVLLAAGGDESPEGAAPVTSVPLPVTAPPVTAPATTAPPPSTTTSRAATTTTTTTPTTTTGPTTTIALGEPLVLIPGGFQTVPFGVEPDVAIARVRVAFGEPTDDTGWIPSADLGPCPGEVVRLVSWGELSLLFTDEASPFAAPGARHFTSWIYTGPAGTRDAGLRTGAGIGLGSTRAELDGAYGERLVVTDDDLFGPSFRVDFEPGGDDFIYLSGAVTDAGPDGIVIGLSGGRGCGE